MCTKPVCHDNSTNTLPPTKQPQSTAFTLVETIISMALIAVIFLLILQSFNSLLMGSYLTDARTAVRNEGEFVGEYLKLRIKNADPRTVSCTKPKDASGRTFDQISWQAKGSSDFSNFFTDYTPDGTLRFCFQNAAASTAPNCLTVLTHLDVNVHDVIFACDTPSYTEAPVANVNISFQLDSTAKLGDRPAVRNVSRFVSVSIR